MTGLFTWAATALQGGGMAKAISGGGWIAVAILCFVLGRCSVDIGAKCDSRNLTATVKARKVDAAADGAAQAERVVDHAAAAKAAAEVEEAVHAIPDQGLSARQRARACVVLRQQGARPDALASAGC